MATEWKVFNATNCASPRKIPLQYISEATSTSKFVVFPSPYAQKRTYIDSSNKECTVADYLVYPRKVQMFCQQTGTATVTIGQRTLTIAQDVVEIEIDPVVNNQLLISIKAETTADIVFTILEYVTYDNRGSQLVYGEVKQ